MRQRMGFSRKSVGSAASDIPAARSGSADGDGSNSGRGDRSTGSTWGDVLMHVVSLPSGASSSSSRGRSNLSSHGSRNYPAISDRHIHHSQQRYSRRSGVSNGLRAGREGEAIEDDVLRARGPSSSSSSSLSSQQARDMVEHARDPAQRDWKAAANGYGGITLPPKAAARGSRSLVRNGTADEYSASVGVLQGDQRRACGHSGRRSLSGEFV